MSKNNQLAVLGVMLMVPGFLLVVGGLAQSGLGITAINDSLNFDLIFFHPAILLGGLLLGLILNVLPIVDIKFQRQDSAFVSTIEVETKSLNLAIVAFIGFLLGTIFLYLLAEEFQIFQPLIG